MVATAASAMAGAERYPDLTYERLDHIEETIRLLSIAPVLSSEGLLQGTLRHTTINNATHRYNRLSYQ